MKTSISIQDFKFLKTGNGHFYVTYKSPVAGKEWGNMTSDMNLIDNTRNEDHPKVADLIRLKKMAKS